ncbi:MAG: bifunctional pyr operon transcriptional regulator/uracil phosphoribosyltransferase PyrR [Massiliimalia sp.]
MENQKVILDEKAMDRAIARISYEIIERNKGVQNLCLIGIYTRGIHLAARIARKIQEVEGQKIPVGWLDITTSRDDRGDLTGYQDKTQIPFEIQEKRVVLVDDVIFTGRSVRSAIDALMKRGRPTSIQLAVLVDRGHRELPIRADFIGKNLPTSKQEQVQVQVTELDGINQVTIWAENEKGPKC